MEPFDLSVRNSTYRLFREVGEAPSVGDVAGTLGAGADEVRSSWKRLHDGHALVLMPDRDELLMANPFSAVPTAYRVHADGRSWYGNCAWDAFGICAALHVDGAVETACAECGDPILVELRDQVPDDASLLFHCLVPAARWWDDIAFT
ncbi:MAG TPA: organomercurial lyase [Acidimicrobiales bacterium]